MFISQRYHGAYISLSVFERLNFEDEPLILKQLRQSLFPGTVKFLRTMGIMESI